MITESIENVAKSISGLFGVLSHPARVEVLTLLKKHEELDVTHLQQKLGISQSSVSQHLHLLKMHGFLAERREGKHVYYRLKSTHVIQVVACAIQMLAMDLASDAELLSACSDLMSTFGA